MARIDVLPSIEIIRGFRGILDFYVWRGLPCVRAWPKYRPTKQTAASLAAALVFGAIVKSYNLLGNLPLEAYRDDALDQARTARDIMVTGAYGNLHEASMSDFLTLLQESRDFLANLQALLGALDSIDTDQLVVNVDQSVLPPGAATAAAQALALAQLQNISDLQDALQSKALDRLLVRGMDQLFTIADVWREQFYTLNADAGTNTGNFATVPAHQLWLLNAFTMYDKTTAIIRLAAGVRDPGGTQQTFAVVQAPGIWEPNPYSGWMPLGPGERVRAYFYGCAAGDDIYAHCHGFKMTLET